MQTQPIVRRLHRTRGPWYQLRGAREQLIYTEAFLTGQKALRQRLESEILRILNAPPGIDGDLIRAHVLSGWTGPIRDAIEAIAERGGRPG